MSLLCMCGWGSREREMGNYPRELCTVPSPTTSPGSKRSLHVLTPPRKGVRDSREVLQRGPAFLTERRGTTLNYFHALGVCSQENEREKNIPNALLRVAYVGGGPQREDRTMTHARVALASPYSRPNTCLSVSVSRGITEEDSATHSPVPRRGAGLFHPTAYDLERSEMAAAVAVPAGPHSGSTAPPAPSFFLPAAAIAGYCAISQGKGLRSVAKTLQEGGSRGNREGHHYVPACPPRSPPRPAPPSRPETLTES